MPILPSQELVSSSQWPVSASVDIHGRVEETDSARGARQLRKLERVIHLARALLLSGKNAVRCIWAAEGSTFLSMMHAALAMKKTGRGVIVNLSSIFGMKGFERTIAYGAAKWAVRGMSKIAARDLGKYGIRVNSL
ncbi:SDR family NAD(P)-dependent oxidoreductase [Pseudomonas sp. ER28]|uniref:SDR family NAD(P)-dependent oxidoreductase n=1 Tax=Pseudomonas sp. ER28 TaxID=3033801 RepID=UPI0023DFCE30|nr:SDR family NAD(P)-dependent oxidoreductase [Pseudomonas sp. ER28]MDF3174610.1 SDR family NAD(P)-dependent oxidoreductase [Pseudomonas sp. ER28]